VLQVVKQGLNQSSLGGFAAAFKHGHLDEDVSLTSVSRVNEVAGFHGKEAVAATRRLAWVLPLCPALMPSVVSGLACMGWAPGYVWLACMGLVAAAACGAAQTASHGGFPGGATGVTGVTCLSLVPVALAGTELLDHASR
jgi:hypothetical protein